MKTAADIIVDLIERFDVHDPGARRAHGNGVNYEAAVALNDDGKAIFGDIQKAVIRLSNVATSQKVPDSLINVKGCSIRFDHPARPIDIIGVTFPYFPFATASETMDLFYRIHWFLDNKSPVRFVNIFGAGNLYRHLGRLARWLPKDTHMDHSYYSAHSYGTDNLKFRLDYDTDTETIEIFAEHDASITDYRPEDEVYLGQVSINKDAKVQEIKFMDALNAPFDHLPKGEIPLLRHFVYRRSFLGRMSEVELDPHKYEMLNELWEEEKYFVLSKDRQLYDEINQLFVAGTEMPVRTFTQLMDQAYDKKYDEETVRDYFTEVWTYFTETADAEEWVVYQELLEAADIDRINMFLADMAMKYEVSELLNSTVVKVLGREKFIKMQKGKI
ncbi:DUF1722 domain-containing protein [Salinicoccus cyprini]|uniref:DUF1722 domain-containing protein n=1 Tax=Salinicoccus cyprini TaxID=2493691 RepID=A0A558AS09_9STAP|nr:DUF1722 domain-containing protein [Salinicoccus cyprini]TVT27057.1 DUF1722 domain-containing protein [Salinicoccus cyprini]